jgi:hypothetical protein
MDIRVRTKLDSRKEEYGASLAALFSASRQMTAVVQAVAMEKGLPWRTVPEVTVMLGDGRRETSTKLFFIEVKAYQSVQATKEPEPILIAAYGVRDLEPAASVAPELPLLRHRFPDSRPALTMGVLSQKEGPIELVIARDYKKHWPMPIATSCFATDKLFLMKTIFHPGQFLCGQADPEAVGTKMRGVKRRLTLGTGESAGSSTSSSRRLGRRRRRRTRRRGGGVTRLRRSGGREKEKRARDPSSRSTSAASSDARLQREVSVPSQRDKEDASIKEKSRKDKSEKRREEESPIRRALAKKKRARMISSRSSSDGLSSSSSSSEDKATAEVKIVNKNEEEQLRVLRKQREARRERRKELREAVREHGAKTLLQRARAFTAAQCEAERKAEAVRAKQQREETEAELSEADQAATEHGEKEGSTERSVRRRTTKQELEESAPPAAGGTSTAAA